MGEMIQFKRPDGKMSSGYLARPATGGDTAPGLVVIQEWWGLNDQMKKVADRYAAQGYRSLVPDLYRGKLAKDADEAGQMMNALNFGDAATQDIRAAALWLRASGAKVAVVGYCMGGALTLIASVKVPELDAGVCFYGIPPKQAADPAQMRVPFQGHFANKDTWCTPAAVSGLEADLKKTKVKWEIYRYDADHAFVNETRPDVYNAAAAKQSFERSLTFLKAHVG
ncbi:MAG: dienelactone hydrolase family protein [Candidatus Lambdaproteobacteria bacterium]|nr:dienelactone hydrolase family protein [Candidatus Lambdaproteobacteria bacterium]